MKYAWTRFWCPRDGRIDLSDGGFLVNPEDEYGRVQTDVVPFDFIEHHACLALLGEPGIGKSTVMDDLRTALEHSLKGSDDHLVYIEMGTL
jgi:hypothetical protein